MFKLALSGKARSGKNTSAKMFELEIQQKLNRKINSISMAFADPLKNIVKNIFPDICDEVLYGPSELRNAVINGMVDSDGNPLTARKALLDMGTMVRRYNEDAWVHNFNHHLKKNMLNNPDLIIVTDCRFRNEFDYLKSNGFHMIRIARHSDYKIQHESEIQQDTISNSEFDFVLDNNGDKENLSKQIERIVKSIC